MFRTLRVARSQRTLHLVDGRAQRVYEPGTHLVWTLSGTHEFVQLAVSVPSKPIQLGDPLPDDTVGTRVISVAAHERVLVFVAGQFVTALGPGRWRWWDELGEPTVVRMDRRSPPAPLADDDGISSVEGATVLACAEPMLLRDSGRGVKVVPAGRYRIWSADGWQLTAIPQAFSVMGVPRTLAEGEREEHVAANERLAVLKAGALLQVLGPGRYVAWDAGGPFSLVRFDTNAEPAAIAANDPLPPGARAEWVESVGHELMALVLVADGQPLRVLPNGRYRAWTGSRWALKQVPLSLQALDVAAQDLLTSDEVPVRVKPAVSVRVADPLAVLRQPDWSNQVYLAVQLALREVISTRTLEALLAERDALGNTILEAARALLPSSLGVALELAAVKDVILPGEIKDLLNRVTLARKEAEALSIKRREETAATRQLANTARMLENNPVLLRLKELEALGEIAARIDKITLVGNGGELMKTVLLSDLAGSR
jgi:regulator of protease activity HflC (stomatin/prohibitin superfamily)